MSIPSQKTEPEPLSLSDKSALIIKQYALMPGENTLIMPAYSQVMSVQPSRISIVMYALIAPHMPVEERNFLVAKADVPLDLDVPEIQYGHPSLLSRYRLAFIGSATRYSDWTHLHVFEKLKGFPNAR